MYVMYACMSCMYVIYVCMSGCRYVLCVRVCLVLLVRLFDVLFVCDICSACLGLT